MMTFTHPHFADPRWLWLAVLGPVVLLALQRYAAGARRRQLGQMASPHFLGELTRSHSPARRGVKEGLVLLAVAAMGLAMARPQWGEQALTEEHLAGEDILFVLDCSRSMWSTDVSPSRIERARLALLDFVQHRGGGRVGLVAFSGEAFLQCPLTYDYDAFEAALEAVDDKTIAVPGTDIGRALEEAVKALDKNSRRKVMVLLTDGEDLEGGGVDEARKLGKQGVVIYTLGVGTPAGSQIQMVNDRGQREWLRDADGNIVTSRLDETTLREMAEVTHGNYYRLGPLGEGLAKVHSAVTELATRSDAERLNKLGGGPVLYTDRAGTDWAGGGIADEHAAEKEGRGGNFKLQTSKSRETSNSKLQAGVCGLGNGRGAEWWHGGACDVAGGRALVASGGVLRADEGTPPAVPMTGTPQELYNYGTEELRAGKLTEAENLLQASVAGQEASLQPVALYNLGCTRVAQGVELLKQSEDPSGRASLEHVNMLTGLAQDASRKIDEAMVSGNVQSMVAAYLRGHGIHREINAALKAVSAALEAKGDVLAKWQRAAGDFRSAAELDGRDTNATYNAEATERAIAALIDKMNQLQEGAMRMQAAGQQLGEQLKQLRGMIPAPDLPPGAPGDEDDEDLPGMTRGEHEGAEKTGKEMKISPEEAERLLAGYKLGGDRRLPMGEEKNAKPVNRSGKNW